MPHTGTSESVTLEPIDHQIIHALQLDGRAAFSRVAAVLGVSEQTVARRYRRMRADGIVRVIGLVDPTRVGQTVWTVRIQCRPDAAGRLADALARRGDVAWVSLGAGGAEITCSVRSATQEQRDELLLQRLPSTSAVLSLSAHAMLHLFLGMRADDWTAHGTLLTRDQARELVDPARAALRVAPAVPARSLEPDDQPLLDALARDGRTSYAALARVTGSTEARVARRIAALRDSGVLFFDVDLASQLLGFSAPANLWLTVAPADLVRVGEAIAQHPEVGGVYAVSGSANLWVGAMCRDTADLYRYVTTRIGSIEGVRSLEISPTLRQVKAAGSMLSGGRLTDPLPSRT